MNAIYLSAKDTTCAITMSCATRDDSTIASDVHGPESCGSNSGKQVKTSKRGGPRLGFGGPQPGSGRPRKVERVIRRAIGPAWYVIQIAPGCERRVARDIGEGERRPGYVFRPEYEIDLPLTLGTRLRREKVVIEPVLMFPGYGMVRFDAEADKWPLIREVDGVVQVFTNRSGRPLPLPADFVDKLRASAPERLSLAARREAPRLPGALLWLDHGPFEHIKAVCVSCDGLVTVAEIDGMGRMVPVELPYGVFSGRVEV